MDGFEFLREAPAHCLQQALKDLEDAFERFFTGQNSYPRPRRRGETTRFASPTPTPSRLASISQAGTLRSAYRSSRGCRSATATHAFGPERPEAVRGQAEVGDGQTGGGRLVRELRCEVELTRSRVRARRWVSTEAWPTAWRSRSASCTTCRSSPSPSGDHRQPATVVTAARRGRATGRERWRLARCRMLGAAQARRTAQADHRLPRGSHRGRRGPAHREHDPFGPWHGRGAGPARGPEGGAEPVDSRRALGRVRAPDGIQA